MVAGSTGDPPVPSGDSPDGTGAAVRANGHGLSQHYSSGRRVADRSGRVARTTHFQNTLSVQKETTESDYFDNGAGSVGCLLGNRGAACASVFAARPLRFVDGRSEELPAAGP